MYPTNKEIQKKLGVGTVSKGISPEDYQKFVVAVWNSRRSSFDESPLRDLFIMTVGLGGESGEVQEILKKYVRDNIPLDRENLKLELGDVIYYVSRIAAMFDIPLQEILDSNVNKLRHRAEFGK